MTHTSTTTTYITTTSTTTTISTITTSTTTSVIYNTTTTTTTTNMTTSTTTGATYISLLTHNSHAGTDQLMRVHVIPEDKHAPYQHQTKLQMSDHVVSSSVGQQSISIISA